MRRRTLSRRQHDTGASSGKERRGSNACDDCVVVLLSGESSNTRRDFKRAGAAAALRSQRGISSGPPPADDVAFDRCHPGLRLRLGVGGIAVALAAQKTLENVIAGASLIFDQALRVGDTLKMGEVFGTVDQIGLRSTRIRTLDRTIVSIPNGQIANATLETISARDKFWFHPVVTLRRDTTPDQLHDVVNGIRGMLGQDPSVDTESVRVRFFRLGAFSLDVEVVAYLFGARLESFPGNPGTVAVQRDGDRQPGRERNRHPVTGDVSGCRPAPAACRIDAGVLSICKACSELRDPRQQRRTT